MHYCIFKNFSWMHYAGIKRTDRNSGNSEDFITGIQKNKLEMLLGFIFYTCPDSFDNALRVFYIKILQLRLQIFPFPKLKTCLNLCCLCKADAFYLRKLFYSCFAYCFDIAEFYQ